MPGGFEAAGPLIMRVITRFSCYSGLAKEPKIEKAILVLELRAQASDSDS